LVNESDIWGSALVLLKQHRDDAVIEASMNADAMVDRGDIEGRAVWPHS
jgi:hypothetical protein